MTFLLATIVYPLLLAALAIGAGLLVDRVAGGITPGVLVPSLGLGLLVAVAELLAWQDATGGLAPYALVVLAIAGYALGFGRLRAAKIDPWPVAAAVVVYVVVCAPVLFSGRVSVPGYLLDTTVAYHLLGSEYLLDHARDFGNLPVSTFRSALEAYFGTGYPSGGQTLLGASGRIVGVERIWLYLPFLAMLLALCSPTLFYLARAASLPRWLAAGAAACAAMPALVYAYAQMGAIKELTALPFILLLGALLLLLPRLLAGGLRTVALPVVVVAGGVGAIGISFAPWVALIAFAAIVLAFTTWDARPSLRIATAWVALGAVALALLALPTFGPLSRSIGLAKSFSTSNQAAVADPGNLVRPLKLEQAAGVWLTGTHRVDPPSPWFQETYLLIGVVAVAALLGVVFLVRRRLWPLVAWLAVSAVVWLVLTRRGTTWTDAKLLVISSPVVVLVAAIGVESLRRAGRKLEGVFVGTLLAGGILLSNAFTYHDTNLQPTARYEELLQIGERFSQGERTLVPEFDEFTVYALRNDPPDGPGYAFKSPEIVTLRDGQPTPYGSSFDLDQFPLSAVEGYPLIVARRRPDSSRPPANFERAFSGRFYDVWRRTDAPQVLDHVPAGAGLQAGARVRCASVRQLARRAAEDGAQLAYVPRARSIVINPARAARPPAWGAI